jgi:glucokinase
MRFALDIGGTSIKCAIVSDDGAIVRAGDFPTKASSDTKEFARSLIEGARHFLSQGDEKITSVGAGMAGIVDGKLGIVIESPNLPGVKNLPLADILSTELGLPAFVDNDATAAAWGEFLFGGHVGISDMLVVTLGTGIGGGLVLDSKLYHGMRGFAGEVGQIPLIPDGPQCPGGGRGCLEYYIGKAGLMEGYRDKVAMGHCIEPDELNVKARAGEKAAKESWEIYGADLGVVLAGISNLLDLGVIILTGGLTGAWEHFEPALLDKFNGHLITPLKGRIPIKVSNLGGKAGTLGAAFLDKAHEHMD